MTAIRCTHLNKTFTQGDQVIRGLDDVCIEIPEGSFVCLSGPSGSGKTTLLNAMGGLDQPDSGEILVGEHRVDQLGKGALADMRLHNIGFVFQAYNLIPVLTARENIEFVMQVQGLPAAERRARAMAILEEVGLADHQDRLPSQLSGGQQQRVAVARAIVSKPTLVLADEPTANLDSASATQLIELFRRLNAERGITFVIATHDTRVMAYCPRLIRMEDGRIIRDEQQSGIPGEPLAATP
ncbi:ATP-binding cassette domain-containing protein [Seongchinamella sediminis]|uniref:ATP-binding cassette domain-containing protein n=1 Tax=Seongchinamella sediminis TaxID=2283635 RepID=A0A3L7DXU1_9GAMM|nr:ABC transporter ATP-binding protein [Seongchinamella sediminis]RLQ21013.1 ATP-binding cassette domain-containing protein [Seongchinamella sediminis]